MGMYTELVLKCEVQHFLPKDVEDILNFLFNSRDVPEELPKHPFFECDRWRHIGNRSSYYHIPWCHSKYSENYIFCRCDLKDYDKEIELFLDWLSPYLYCPVGACIGWTWYEEDDVPTLIYKK